MVCPVGKSAASYPVLPMIQELNIPYTDSLSMVRLHVGNIPESGLAHLRPPAVFSRCEGTILGISADDMCRMLLNESQASDLRVYTTGDGSDVYEDTFMNIAKPNGDDFKPTLVLIGTRLGIDKVTPVYWEALKSALQMSQSIGIAG